MDERIASLPVDVRDRDLALCLAHGVAFQTTADRVDYDETYFDKCRGYDHSAIADQLNSWRIELVNGWVSEAELVLDVGIGSGEFIRRRPRTMGHDVNEAAISWLHEQGKWGGNAFFMFRAFTFWDVIEHVPEPHRYFQKMRPGSYLFTSLPIFQDLRRIRESRHYRPGEHLYYWTHEGFRGWLGAYGFELLEHSDRETELGRDSIRSYAFRRARWPRPEQRGTIFS